MEDIQLTLFGKTFPEHSVQTKERISGEFSKKSQKPKFHYLKVENGLKADWLSYQTVQSLGELSMPNIGASPSVARGSTLSQILEVNAPQKYYLSPKACRGTLRRAEKRGKELPPLLKAALEAQANGKFLVTDTSDFQSAGFISRAPAESYSIGYEEEMSATLRSGLITDVMQSKIFVKSTRSRNASVGGCPNNSSTAGLGEKSELAPTLSTTKNVGVCYTPTDLIYAIDRAAFNQGENAKYDFQIEDNGVNSTIVARGPSAVLDCRLSVWIVRRLTPRECERLQGFPDDWTMLDTGGNKLKDAPRYKGLGNSIAILCALRVVKGIFEAMADQWTK